VTGWATYCAKIHYQYSYKTKIKEVTSLQASNRNSAKPSVYTVANAGTKFVVRL